MAPNSKSRTRTRVKVVHECSQEAVIKRQSELLDRLATVTLGNGHPENGLLFLFRTFLEKREKMEADIADIKTKVEAAIRGSDSANHAIEMYKAEMGGVEKAREDGENKDRRNKEESHAKTIRILTTISVTIGAIALVITSIFTILNHSAQKGIKTEVDMINTPVKTRSGTIEFWPSGVLIDSLNKQRDTIK